jgi:hypothetical protein
VAPMSASLVRCIFGGALLLSLVLASPRSVYADNVVTITNYAYKKANGTTGNSAPASGGVSLPAIQTMAEINACVGNPITVTVTVVGGLASDTCQATITPVGGMMIALNSTHPGPGTWKITIPTGTMTANSNWVLNAPVKKQSGLPRGSDTNNVAVKAYP